MKRIRLFIDVMMSDEEIRKLQEIVDKQPVTTLIIQEYFSYIGRFEGATPVQDGHAPS